MDLIYIDPPFKSNRNYEVFWGEAQEEASFQRPLWGCQSIHSLYAPACEGAYRVLKKTGSFYYHCDWHASHYVKVMLDEIFGVNFFHNEITWKRSDSHNDA
ncbi:MAG: hypothetical protein H0W62_04730 [Chitinophagales bacterium]|nr:hypothetical protein [Chitinophagales bacterium]